MKVLEDPIKIARKNFKHFEEIADIALTVHCLPASNAVIERIFLAANITSKAPKQVVNDGAIVRIENRFHFSLSCSRNFVATEKIFSLFNDSM